MRPERVRRTITFCCLLALALALPYSQHTIILIISQITTRRKRMEYNHEEQPPAKKMRVDEFVPLSTSDDDFDDPDDFFDTPVKPSTPEPQHESVTDSAKDISHTDQPLTEGVKLQSPATSAAASQLNPNQSQGSPEAPKSIMQSRPTVQSDDIMVDGNLNDTKTSLKEPPNTAQPIHIQNAEVIDLLAPSSTAPWTTPASTTPPATKVLATAAASELVSSTSGLSTSMTIPLNTQESSTGSRTTPLSITTPPITVSHTTVPYTTQLLPLASPGQSRRLPITLSTGPEPSRFPAGMAVSESEPAVDVEPTASTSGAGETKQAVDPDFLKVAQANKQDEAAEWQYDSSDAESDATSDSSSDDSDDDSDAEDYVLLDPREQARILMREEGGSDDEGKPKKGGRVAPRTANEEPDVKVEKPDIEVTPDMVIKELGLIEVIVENMALVKGTISAETQVLESGSLLCLDDRKVIGVVAEPIGRVEEPRYSVAFTNAAEIVSYGLTVGKKIFYVLEHTKFVFTQPLKLMKGTDASNQHDEEAGMEEFEFSDDEAEAEHKRKIKQEKMMKKGLIKPDHMRPDPIASRGATPDVKYDDTPLKYDDDDADDLYTPLARPTGLGTSPMPPRPAMQQAGRGGAERGRGRGRGRGDRGRGDRGRGGRGRGGSQQYNHTDSTSGGGSQQYNPIVPAMDTTKSPVPVNQQQSTVTPSSFEAPSQGQQAMPGFPGFNGSFPMFPGMQGQQQQFWNPAFGGAQFPMQTQQQHAQFGMPPPGSYVNPAFFAQYQQGQMQNPQQFQQPGPMQNSQQYQNPQQFQQQFQQRQNQQQQGHGQRGFGQAYNPNQPWTGQ